MQASFYINRLLGPNALRLLSTTTSRSNYFQILGVSERFDIDLSDLATRFKCLQREWHPDRHAHGASGTAQEEAAKTSALLNEAYSALRSPHTRARHLLTVLGEGDEAEMDPDFLAWVVERREQIANTPPSSDAARALVGDVEHAFTECVEQLRHRFNERALAAARTQTAKLKYLSRIRAAAEELLE